MDLMADQQVASLPAILSDLIGGTSAGWLDVRPGAARRAASMVVAKNKPAPA
jgi:hypothetical protein